MFTVSVDCDSEENIHKNVNVITQINNQIKSNQIKSGYILLF